MNKLFLGVALVATISFLSCKEEASTQVEAVETEQSEDLAMANLTFGVRGNCSMCKETIENAVTAVDGVSKANWNIDKKKIDVSFDDTKTDASAIHKAIAAAGYDTEEVEGDLNAYENLHSCCKYDRTMAMNR